MNKIFFRKVIEMFYHYNLNTVKADDSGTSSLKYVYFFLACQLCKMPLDLFVLNHCIKVYVSNWLATFTISWGYPRLSYILTATNKKIFYTVLVCKNLTGF